MSFKIFLLSLLLIPVAGATSSDDYVNTATVTSSANVLLVSIPIVSTNNSRKGLVLYNNSANSVYIKYGSLGNAGSDMTYIIATFASWTMPKPIYIGPIYGIRNAGSGTMTITELSNK